MFNIRKVIQNSVLYAQGKIAFLRKGLRKSYWEKKSHLYYIIIVSIITIIVIIINLPLIINSYQEC